MNMEYRPDQKPNEVPTTPPLEDPVLPHSPESIPDFPEPEPSEAPEPNPK